jgi:hypothetical protein
MRTVPLAEPQSLDADPRKVPWPPFEVDLPQGCSRIAEPGSAGSEHGKLLEVVAELGVCLCASGAGCQIVATASQSSFLGSPAQSVGELRVA